MTPQQAHLLNTPPSAGLADLLTRNGYPVPANALDAVYIARSLGKHVKERGWWGSWLLCRRCI